MTLKCLLILLTVACLLLSTSSIEDEDLAFLKQRQEQLERNNGGALPDYENYADLEEFGDGDLHDFDGDQIEPPIDETHVVVLKGSNFTDFIDSNRFVMVEFYAPWCGHCQALAPEYAAAAAEMKESDESVVLAKVDATEEAELSQQYDVQGYPTIYFFVDGVHKPYPGLRTKDAIVSWLKKKTGPVLHNVSTTEEADRILVDEEKLVFAYVENLVGPESEALAAASRLEDDISFYQTTSPDVAKLFHIDPNTKRPALVVLKKQAEKIARFRGHFTESAIAGFVFDNKLPLVINMTKESAPLVFENPIKKQLILFAASHDSENFYSMFLEAAKAFKGKLVCVFVDLDNDDVGKQISEYFGVKEGSVTVLAYTGNDDARKFMLEGDLTISNIKFFGENFLADNLKPFYKSDPIPEKNDGDIKIVVGNNFDEIVLDESKDVLLEIYAPWCGHCQALEPIYNKLGKHLRGIDSLVIAKMDGTTNEHPRAKPDGFPTILFFPAGNKSFDPITFEGERTVVEFYKFLKNHASIPFKLQKPTTSSTSSDTTTSAAATAISSEESSSRSSKSSIVKDEL